MNNQMNELSVNSILFEIIKIGLGLNDDRLPNASEVDFKELTDIGIRQSILPIICQGLRKSGITGEDYNEIDRKSLRDVFRFVNSNVAIEVISRCFEEEQIPFVLLKGATIRNLYPEPWLRTASDIDILVHEYDIDRACALLVEKTDFKKKKREYHDVLLTNNKTCLELHFSIMETMEGIDSLLKKVWDYCNHAEGTCQYVMSNEFQIFYVIAHMTYHLTHGGLGIRPYIDLWLLRNRTDFDEHEVLSMCSACGVAKFYQNAVLLSEVWLANAQHTLLTKALEELALEGGVFGNSTNAASMGIRNKGKIGFITYRLFPPYTTMAEQFPILKGKKLLLPLYYVKRMCGGISLRKRITKELNLIKSSDQKEIQSVDELLNELGL